MNTKNSKQTNRSSDIGNRTNYGSMRDSYSPKNNSVIKKPEDLSIRILFRTSGTSTALVNPTGVVMKSNVKLLYQALDKCLDQRKDTIILNMSDVDTIDKHGWKCVYDTLKHFKHERAELFLCGLKSEMVADSAFYGAKYNNSIKAFRTISECQKIIESVHVHQKKRSDSQVSMSATSSDPKKVADNSKRKPTLQQIKSTDISGSPVREKIKKIISRYGPSSIFEILTHLRSSEFNNTRINLLELYVLLKEMDLNSMKKRERLYRAS